MPAVQLPEHDHEMYQKLSKRISYILRHSPESIGSRIDDQGWMDVKELLDAIKVGEGVLREIVSQDEKGRYEFNDDETRIRACQGHSVPVELGYTESAPPDVLYHGTIVPSAKSILKDGLTKQKRHHVHLSEDYLTAYKVGTRRRPDFLVLLIDAKKMCKDGYKFFCSNNGVWLTEHASPQYLFTEKMFVREGDDKEFLLILESHWSEIISRDGEVDGVKWLWGENDYIGHSGNKFIKRRYDTVS